MKLVTYRHSAHGPEAHAGVIQGDRVLNAARLLGRPGPLGMRRLLEMDSLPALAASAEQFAADYAETIHVPRDVAVPAWDATFLAPVPDPPSIRDFYAFEQHVAAGYKARGRDVPAAWYEFPVFFFLHNGNLLGPDEPVIRPAGVAELDFELEIAAVIGRGGRDIPAAEAWDHVAGMTVLNDWSARDLQRREMSVGLGPAKSKDFATSLGPVLVTLDDLCDRIDGERIDLAMSARVNDEVVGQDTSASMRWTFPQLIARAAQGVALRPGDVIASGTCGGGCLLELGTDVHPWLAPGDEVELEIDRIGRLRTPVAGD